MGLIATPAHSSVKFSPPEFRADEIRQEKYLDESQGEKNWVRERPYLFKYFPISKFKDYNWAICNTNWLTHISAWMRGAFLLCSVSEFNFYTLVFTAVLWISRLFQSLAVRARDWPVNLAPSQWDLTQMSLCIDHLSPPLTLFSWSSLLSSTINGLLSHCSQSPVNMFSPCSIHPTSNSHLFFTLADFVLPLVFPPPKSTSPSHSTSDFCHSLNLPPLWTRKQVI